MAEIVPQEHFFRYTDPNKSIQNRLSALEAALTELQAKLEMVMEAVGAQMEAGGHTEAVNPDFRAWVKGEIQGIKMRLGKLRQQ